MPLLVGGVYWHQLTAKVEIFVNTPLDSSILSYRFSVIIQVLGFIVKTGRALYGFYVAPDAQERLVKLVLPHQKLLASHLASRARL